MKNLKFIGFLMILASSLLFIQCTTDTIVGPAGADGTDGANGIDGINGINGLDGVNGLDGADIGECIACHSNSHRDPIRASYELSGHNNASTLAYAGARAGCAQCHSSEGYIDYMTTGSTNPAGYYGLSEPTVILDDNGTPDDDSDDFPKLGEFGEILYSNNPVPVVTPISCKTCHSSHLSFDFENDGNDFALRGLEPVTLITDGTVIDFGNKSNVCISCHQPRRTGPTPDVDGNFKITSTHWGPHHGPQATLYEGIQGAEITGPLAYPTPGTSTHRLGASCTSCHMGETTDGTDGAHTWVPTENACNKCHATVPEVTGLDADMETLGHLLETAGALHFDEGWHPVRGTFSIEVAEAAWNFLFIYEDMSKGIHNPGYAKALIVNSINALQ